MATPADHRAPEGAFCALHRERPAHFTCSRCGSYACVACWHAPVALCQSCIVRDPAAAAPPIAWEQRDKPLSRRYFGTLASAFSPFKSAPAFAQGEVSAALRFMLVSALPLAMLAGVIPHTRTLLFAGNFDVQLVGHPSQADVAWDIVRAMLIELGLTGLQLGCLLLPFASLVRAYAPARRDAAPRALYYRIWLLPAAMLIVYAAAWALPAPGPGAAQAPAAASVLVLTGVLSSVLLILAMTGTARLACGLGPLLSTVVVVVPLLLMQFGYALATLGLARWLPDLSQPPPGP